MSTSESPLMDVLVVEEQMHFTLASLSRACGTDHDQVRALVVEGLLEPAGDAPDAWRFDGASLRRARTALRLSHDLELSLSGTAIVMDLMAEIERLRACLQRR
jgi:chaperone modulatory protein CbpM